MSGRVTDPVLMARFCPTQFSNPDSQCIRFAITLGGLEAQVAYVKKARVGVQQNWRGI